MYLLSIEKGPLSLPGSEELVEDRVEDERQLRLGMSPEGNTDAHLRPTGEPHKKSVIFRGENFGIKISLGGEIWLGGEEVLALGVIKFKQEECCRRGEALLRPLGSD
jgi:hypothetical protein